MNNHKLEPHQIAVLLLLLFIIFMAIGIDSLVFIAIMAWLFLPWKEFILQTKKGFNFVKRYQRSA